MDVWGVYLLEASRVTPVGFNAFSLSRRLLSLGSAMIGHDARDGGWFGGGGDIKALR